MKILGISAYYHDSAACIIEDGEIIAAVQEERFTRIKHDASFPVKSIKYCLQQSKTTIGELAAVAYYEKPFLKFERLIESYFTSAPFGLRSFLKSMPVWLKEKLNLKNTIYKNLQEIEEFQKSDLKVLFPEHHVSHIASAFFTSPFSESAILTMDGVGEWTTSTMAVGKNKEINILSEMRFPHSLGLLYSAFTYYLGFKINNGEYKVMGLAPFGNRESQEYKQYSNTIRTQLIDLKPDGSFWLNQFYFDYIGGLKMIDEEKWSSLFNMVRRKEGDKIIKAHCNLALVIQDLSEEIVLKQVATLKKISNQKNLCIAGGVGLNCVINGKIVQSNIFEKVYFMPAAGDAGGAIGASLASYHMYYQLDRHNYQNSFSPMLGPEFTDEHCLDQIKSFDCRYQHYENNADLVEETSQLLKEGNIVGWFQGKMEFGPRALGNRSILADPTWFGMQEKINVQIKNRENFRPFAPAILKEHANDYFEMEGESPYMLEVAKIKEEFRLELPPDFQSREWQEMLSEKRSSFQATTHVDFSSRIQTVDFFQNPKFYKLLKSFYDKTGIPMLLNTSFNLRGEPIVCTPLDALRCFFNTEMDILVLNKYIIKKV